MIGGFFYCYALPMRKLYLVDTETLDRIAEVTDEWVKDHPELWDMGFVIEVDNGPTDEIQVNLNW